MKTPRISRFTLLTEDFARGFRRKIARSRLGVRFSSLAYRAGSSKFGKTNWAGKLSNSATGRWRLGVEGGDKESVVVEMVGVVNKSSLWIGVIVFFFGFGVVVVVVVKFLLLFRFLSNQIVGSRLPTEQSCSFRRTEKRGNHAMSTKFGVPGQASGFLLKHSDTPFPDFPRASPRTDDFLSSHPDSSRSECSHKGRGRKCGEKKEIARFSLFLTKPSPNPRWTIWAMPFGWTTGSVCRRRTCSERDISSKRVKWSKWRVFQVLDILNLLKLNRAIPFSEAKYIHSLWVPVEKLVYRVWCQLPCFVRCMPPDGGLQSATETRSIIIRRGGILGSGEQRNRGQVVWTSGRLALRCVGCDACRILDFT